MKKVWKVVKAVICTIISFHEDFENGLKEDYKIKWDYKNWR